MFLGVSDLGSRVGMEALGSMFSTTTPGNGVRHS